MAITPAIAIHKVRHPSSPSNLSVFMAAKKKLYCCDRAKNFLSIQFG
jgi:hypothetical protein